MKAILFGTTLVLLSSPVTAAVYKCTDANGVVSFSDRPCGGQQQEVMRDRSYRVTEELDLPAQDDPQFQIDPIEPLAGGKKVSRSSPLARVYLQFVSAVKRCDRDEMAKHVASAWATDILQADDREFNQGCRVLRELMPADFEDATEVIDGDSGTIQWLSVESSTDATGTSTMKFETTGHFVKEDGEWKFNGS